MSRADIGLIGLAVMGENLVLNMASHGFTVAVYNRTTAKVDAFMADRARDKSIIGTHSPAELLAQLKKPRRVMLMVQAGQAVDRVIAELVPLLDQGDILIDGGNSNYQDTARRTQELAAKGLLYVGTGVSGGEEGALKGPSIMPGGNPDAWPHIKDLFQAIAAKVEDGSPCCDWVGRDGAGHYVKMVHNGIEYGDMQMIAEAYALMREGLGIEPQAQSEIFKQWNEGELDSYLIEITGDILAKIDDETGQPMVDVILDAAGQKGTGKWTGIDALQLGAPVTAITEAVFSRALSFSKTSAWLQPASSKAQMRRLLVTKTLLSKTSAKPCTRLKFAPTPKAISCSLLLPANTSGNSTMEASPYCGAAAALFAPSFWAASRKPLTRIQRWPICCSHRTSAQHSRKPKRLGAESWLQQRPSAYPCRPLPAPSRTTTVIAPPTCPPICSKPSATTLVPTHMSAPTSRAACSFTLTGPGAGERRRQRLTTPSVKNVWQKLY